MNKPKILIWDVESSLQLSLHFEVWEATISKENVVIPSYIHCISYKWLGEKKIHTISQTDFPLFKKDIHNDYEVLKEFSKIAQKADYALAHNGDAFDIRKLNARLILQGLEPIPVHKTIDTLKLARRYFKFDWNNLDYLSKALGHKGKMETPKGLWRRCFEGDKKAFKIMAKYNRQDIDALEFIYKKISPFERSSILGKKAEIKCQNIWCSSFNVQLRGIKRDSHEFQCQDCLKWGRVKL